ncbi:hypothetical protein ATK36_3431 [Amycolatopsis sulphurea]|uniref:ABC-2 type transport system permease protein n=1 Tax=Amycolatopsis sulphurea TaxID=76022 RepID=A0A2A9FC39_9PSEU|nr:hypothetical protein [Amycolatopsis sulphurea]PFG48346.1 hypothetical protein ATK36_3431 [Amycolatopsis sulphurea]
MIPVQAPVAQQPSWQLAAQRRASFGTLLAVELRKMTATVADKILVIAGPLVLAPAALLFLSGSGRSLTTEHQLTPVFVTIRMAAVLMNVVLVKLIAAEWHYRSAQPTLLAQPSRLRYVLAQATIAMGSWLVIFGLQVLLVFAYYRNQLEAHDIEFLLGYRTGAILAAVAIGTFAMTLLAVTIGWLIPNTAGAITAYVLVSLLFGFLQTGKDYAGWVDPIEPARQLSGIAKHGPLALVTSLLLWLGLAGAGIWRAGTREAA